MTPMDPNFLGNYLHVEIAGVDEVSEDLQRLYPEVVGQAVEAANDAMVELLQGVEDETPYTYVSWADIGGFITPKQAAFVHAMMAQGLMSAGMDTRTGELAGSWEKVGSGENQYVVSTAPHAPWVMGQGEQARMHIAQGWLDDYEWARKHEDEIGKAFQDAVDQAVEEFNDSMTAGAAPGL